MRQQRPTVRRPDRCRRPSRRLRLPRIAPGRATAFPGQTERKEARTAGIPHPLVRAACRRLASATRNNTATANHHSVCACAWRSATQPSAFPAVFCFGLTIPRAAVPGGHTHCLARCPVPDDRVNLLITGASACWCPTIRTICGMRGTNGRDEQTSITGRAPRRAIGAWP